jgi:YD repeat-containing protein
VETYDTDGLLTTVDQLFPDPDDVSTTLTYRTAFEYDAQDRLRRVVSPGGAEQTWQYDDRGRIVRHVDAAGVARETDYGPWSTPVARREGGETVATWDVDGMGLVEAERDPDGNVVATYQHTALGQLREATLATGESLTITYGASLQPEVLDFVDRGGVGHQITAGYDGLGRLTSRTSPERGTVAYGYDAYGHVDAVVDAFGTPQTWVHDALGRVLSYTDKAAQTSTWTYTDGRVTAYTDRNGDVLDVTYDDAGRVWTITSSTSATSTSSVPVSRVYAYDALGRLVRADADGVVTERTYLDNGLATERTTAPGVPPLEISYARDPGEVVLGSVGPLLDVSYDYDLRGRVESAWDSTLGTFDSEFDARGRRSRVHRSGFGRTDFGYDALGRIENLVTYDGGGTVHGISYGYDVRGFVSAMTDDFGTVTYTHDDGGRLTSAGHPGGSPLDDEGYAWDVNNRRTSWTGNPQTDVLSNEADRLLQDATHSYGYDAKGQRSYRELRVDPTQLDVYVWNTLGQLVEVRDADGDVHGYRYDGLGRRVVVE